MRLLKSEFDFEEWQVCNCGACGEPWRAAPSLPESATLCPDCQAKVCLVDARDEEKAALGRRIQLARSDLTGHLRACGTPGRYAQFSRASWEAKWGPWRDHAKFRQIVDWPQASPMPGEQMDDWLIFLHGKFGRRKTGLATAILGEALCRGFAKCRWEDMNTWLRELRDDDFANYEKVWWRAAKASLLIFDGLGDVKGAGLGREVDGSWWTTQVAEMMRYRHAWAYPTVATSNGSIEDLGLIDRGLPSRMHVRLAWKMGGEDFRAPK